MTSIITVLCLAGICLYMTYYAAFSDTKKKFRDSETPMIFLGVLLLCAFVVRIIFAANFEGHETDMNCFNSWSNMIFNNGISNFYASDSFTDYPPGYMYVLYIIGAIKSLFNIADSSATVLIKMPAILADIATGILLYKIASKKFDSNSSLIISGLYLFNPAIILNSAIWGQVDSVYTVLMAVMVYLIISKKMIPAYYIFAVCIFIKPQALIITPVLIYGIIENVFLPKFNKELFVKNLLFGLGAILLMVIMALPFGIDHVIDQYRATLESYPHATVNAFNLWGAFGKNWDELTPLISGAGAVFILAIVAFTTYVFFKSKNPAKYYFLAGFLVFSTYMLSTKMHDRYAFPAMVMFLLAFIASPKLYNFNLYTLVSLSQFFNTAWVLFIYEQDINKYFKSPVIVAASWINLAIYAYVIYIARKEYNNYSESAVLEKNTKKAQSKPFRPAKPLVEKSFQRSNTGGGMTWRDWTAAAVITVIYGVVAIYNLGDMQAPETSFDLSNKSVTMDFGQEMTFTEYGFFNSYKEFGEERALKVEFKDANNRVVKSDNITSAAVFFWTEKSLNNVSAQYITLSTEDVDVLELKEFFVKDSDGNYAVPVNGSELSALFDEQAMVSESSSYRNSTYFDEIYHARTGYEFLHSLPVYEWTHPPLGKVLIACGIALFGMNPFGWRIAGTFIGILMVPVMYCFAKKLLKKSWIAALTCILFTFDFMHFAQTRIATIDVYGTFFIILMYYFMYKYVTLSFYDTPLKKTFIPLGLCGITMGLGIASKWTAIYAAMGLAVIFFISLYRRYSEYLYAKKTPGRETDGISHKEVIEKFPVYARNTIIFCCIFFIVIPAIIYCASYFMYLRAPGSEGLKTIIENQESMYAYHAHTVLGAEHAYSSKWYEWLYMKRPILYYAETTADGLKEGISAFGNPAVWWVGFVAFLYMAYRWVTARDKKAGFLVIAYLAQIVSWIPIERLTFIYHAFPSIPFLVLSLGYSMRILYERAKDKRAVIVLCVAFTAVAVGLFVMFYPVLSGMPITEEYAETLKWFDSWVLVI